MPRYSINNVTALKNIKMRSNSYHSSKYCFNCCKYVLCTFCFVGAFLWLNIRLLEELPGLTNASSNDDDVIPLRATRMCTHDERRRHVAQYCDAMFGYPLSSTLKNGTLPRGFQSTQVGRRGRYRGAFSLHRSVEQDATAGLPVYTGL